MIVDTSALLAVLYGENDAEYYASAIADDEGPSLSAANFLEAGIAIDRQVSATAGRLLDAFVERANIAVEPVTEAQVRIARQAYLDYGKGNHPAALNFGDCFAYALSKEKGEPLLFKGDDFSQTDILQPGRLT